MTDWLPWPEVSLEKTVDSRLVFTGDTITYSLRIVNTGPMDLSNIQIDDPLPAGLEFLDASVPGLWKETLKSCCHSAVLSLPTFREILC